MAMGARRSTCALPTASHRRSRALVSGTPSARAAAAARERTGQPIRANSIGSAARGQWWVLEPVNVDRLLDQQEERHEPATPDGAPPSPTSIRPLSQLNFTLTAYARTEALLGYMWSFELARHMFGKTLSNAGNNGQKSG